MLPLWLLLLLLLLLLLFDPPLTQTRFQKARMMSEEFPGKWFRFIIRGVCLTEPKLEMIIILVVLIRTLTIVIHSITCSCFLFLSLLRKRILYVYIYIYIHTYMVCIYTHTKNDIDTSASSRLPSGLADHRSCWPHLPNRGLFRIRLPPLCLGLGFRVYRA